MARDRTEVVRAALAAWPGIALDADTFGAYLSRVDLPRDQPLSQELADELALVCAVGYADPAALRTFDREYFAALPAAMADLGLDRSEVEDVLQRLREKLLVAPSDGQPRIDAYVGRGRLRGLLRVAAVRAGIDLLRTKKRIAADADEPLLQLPDTAETPELSYIKANHRAHFRAALEEAATRLSPRQRSLLRLHLLDGVGLSPLAISYGVHRSTIVRWIAAARAALLQTTHELLAQTLALEPPELEAYGRLLQSQLDLSIRRLLASHGPNTA